MDQTNIQFHYLDIAARDIASYLDVFNIRHAFIGGYAASLIGGERMTRNLDVIIDGNKEATEGLLIRCNSEFQITLQGQLSFYVPGARISIKLFQGGTDRQFKLPDAKTVRILDVTANYQRGRIPPGLSIPIVHPSILILMKFKRWAFISHSTRTVTVQKRVSQVRYIEEILKYLHGHGMQLDFRAYPERREVELFSAVRKFYELHHDIRPLLESTLSDENLRYIKC